MILKASQRSGAGQLARHLLRSDDNEHVELHDLRGFVAGDLKGALQEAWAISRATRCTQFLFSLSLNPPPEAWVPVETFETAIAQVEEKLGLQEQPRAIVFHEKDGRRHAHAVWSRIDGESLTAVQMSHYKTKLREVAKQLYLENDWQMPRGFVDSEARDPATFSCAEWQQAKRAQQEPQQLKAMFQECWAISDGRAAFAQALAERGYSLARGDRRGHVAVDHRGEVYAVSRWVDKRAKEVAAKLGPADDLPSVAEAKERIAARMTDALKRHVRETEERHVWELAPLLARRQQLVERQREERRQLEANHARRTEAETAERAGRLRRGLGGLWDRLTGKHTRLRRRNEAETDDARRRDRAEKQALVNRQLAERRPLHRDMRSLRRHHAEQIAELHRDLAHYREWQIEPPAPEKARPRRRGRQREWEP